MNEHAAVHLIRGMLLLQQKKYAEAKAEFRQELAADPQNGVAHAYLGIALVELKRFDEAEREAKAGVHLAPDQAFPHHALAAVLIERRRLKEAEQAIKEAIRLNPAEADQYSALASIHLQNKRWQDALDAANEGLKFDPEHVGCTNIRAVALRNLGQTAAADQTVESLLQRAPENSAAHANNGWAQLSAGRHREAMESFREALRLDPTNEWARSGLLSAMKARNFIYRWMLKFFLFTSRLSSRAQWGLIIGLWVGFRMLRGVARLNPELAPYLWPVIIAYVVFVYLTWTANPLFNLMLRLDRFGRYALSREEITASNCVAACILGIFAGIIWWWLGPAGDERGLVLAIMSALIVIPVAAIFHAESGWPRSAMTGYVAVLCIAAVASLAGMSMTPEAAFAGPLFMIFLLAALLAPWAGNALAMARPTR